MDIPLRVEVRCTDEICGKSTVIIVDPDTDTVTHFVVQVSGGSYLVPIDVITESAPDHIQLRWSKAELEAAEPFERLETLSADEQMMQMQAMSGSYVGYSAGGMPGEYMAPIPVSSTFEVEQIPEHERALHQGADVEATDGRVGQIDEFLIEPDTGKITHVVIRQGHIGTKKDVTIPVAEIDRIEDDVVYLKLDKDAVSQLPSARAPKK
jgi:sporulation protein YlmC with PRC-barrel domain